MSGLREALHKALSYFTRSDLTPGATGAVLRVLAEHGGDEKLREIESILAHPLENRPWRDIVRFLLDGLRAAVAARDAAVEVTERLQVKIRQLDRAVVEWHDRAEGAQAELAAARQQLDQVRAAVQSGDDALVFKVTIRRILDAPARPAGHDESGQ